ncbi:MAG: acetyl-CoA carboxylase, biotin carboxyl carrier protein [Elusimicrobia bacterium CG_4_10_14_0_8_um_filter_37_32]|nr:MAG: acetyl-CoA carboxylase, biotin carboxyl carrier protein [Elusimicrobia bacterium CG02_land_8_20_14_3_00_37_13]PIZ14103.1 MAG: acetyl-CoA carboxylase, biotin carboxyl carrier protein [Elusimicrobia bacterium CG_4_10_14_0_8_um_filter_37_32]
MTNSKEQKKVDKISELYNLMIDENLEELELKDSTHHVKLRRKSAKTKPEVTPVVTKETITGTRIKSPLNGTFYRALSPQSEPFVKEGDTVEQGAILYIIEAMKVMNEIRTEKRCRITRIFVENGKVVNVGEDMFLIELL